MILSSILTHMLSIPPTTNENIKFIVYFIKTHLEPILLAVVTQFPKNCAESRYRYERKRLCLDLPGARDHFSEFLKNFKDQKAITEE